MAEVIFKNFGIWNTLGTPDPKIKLTTASGKRLVCYGKRERTLNIGGKTMTHTFIIAEVGKSILGSDFLLRFGFSVDYYGQPHISAR